MVGSGANIAFVPDVGSSLRIHLESEACVCSFSSEFLFIFEILNLYVFSMYALFLPFCSSRSAPPFPLVPGLAPESLLAAIFRGRARRARPLLLLYVLLLLLGAEPEGLDPYCYCMFYYYYYYYYYYIRPMGVYGSPMNGTWENDEIWHAHRYGHK